MAKLRKRTRCLFISNVPLGSIFEAGAGNSLRTFLENQQYLKVDLILPLFIGQMVHWSHIIRQAFLLKSENLNKIYFLPLPYHHCHEGAPTSFKAKLAYLVNNMLFFFISPLTKGIIFKKDYKFIHLNSIVLHTLISQKANFVIHVREVVNQETPEKTRLVKTIGKAAGVIFIDKKTYSACKAIFKNDSLPCHQIINNPFDMKDIHHLKKMSHEIRQHYGLANYPGKIFSYLGMLHPIKGIELIIKAFLNAKLEKAVLLLAGPGNISDVKYYTGLAKEGTDRILFLGRLNFTEVKEIYAISDFVVRGDPDFRIGRTTFEALFSGCNVIIPGNAQDLMNEPALKPFESRIHLYSPGDTVSLSDVLRTAYTLNTSKSVHIGFHDNNISTHCADFKNFLEGCGII